MTPFHWETFGEWVTTGIVWAAPLALNLRALTRLNPETLIVFRTSTLIGVAAGDCLYLGRELGARILAQQSKTTLKTLSRNNTAHVQKEGEEEEEVYHS